MLIACYGFFSCKSPRYSKYYHCSSFPIYGLEILALKTRDIEKLDRFHRDTLRQFQSLPKRAAIPSVYLLLGALPIEAELHKRQLSFLYILLSAENVKLKRIIEHQLCVNFDNKGSFFYRILYRSIILDVK